MMIESNRISIAYIKKVEYTGSYQGMRFLMRKSEEGMDVFAWPEPLCYSKADKETMDKKSFPLTAEGKEEAVNWLNSLYQEKYVNGN